MCGISGVLLREGERAEERLLGSMARAMRRRGPDAEGLFVLGRVGLAHRRLRILDLSDAANQPMFNEERSVGVVFNGEIYNFAELRTELEKAGHSFRTRSDTEVIVHGFEEWGASCFARFNGMFALAIWDGREAEPELWLARDRFGVKPLFLSRREGRLAFASELKPLLEIPWVSRELDLGAVHRFLKFSHVPSPGTIFRGVEQLPPGTWLRAVAGDTGRFHGPEELLPGRDPLLSKEGEPDERSWLNELESVLDRSVRRQLVSDVPVGCFLSGGVDSSLLAFSYVSAASAGSAAIETFSIGYREKEFDETPFAAEIARALGTTHHELIATPSDFLDLIPEVPDHFDQPFADPTLLSSLLLARFARQRVTVALSGDGGDELFFGYAQQAALLRFERLMSAPQGARQAVFSAASAAGRALSRFGIAPARADRLRKLGEILSFGSEAELLQGFIGTIGPLPAERLSRLLCQSRAREAAPFVLAPSLEAMTKELEGLAPEDRIAQAFIRTFLLDTVLAKTDRATMAYGLEARVPFLDDGMASFSARLPFRYKLRGRSTKYLLRKLLERRLAERKLPIALSRRPKQGFGIPLRDWLRGDLSYLLQEYLHPPRLRREGIFEAGPVNELVQEHVRGFANHSHLLWSLISFQMWKERYLG